MLRDAEAGDRCSVKTYGDRCASVERVGACVRVSRSARELSGC